MVVCRFLADEMRERESRRNKSGEACTVVEVGNFSNNIKENSR